MDEESPSGFMPSAVIWVFFLSPKTQDWKRMRKACNRLPRKFASRWGELD